MGAASCPFEKIILYGELLQRYAPELTDPVGVETVTEAQFGQIRKTLIRPFRIIRSGLFRGCVYQTEQTCYLFLDVHHTLCDGTGCSVLLRDIGEAYGGRVFEKKDTYYELLRARERMAESDFYIRSREYFEKKYIKEGYASIPAPDVTSKTHTMGSLEAELGVSGEAVDRLGKAAGISRNGFFVAAGLLAMAACNASGKVRCSWIYHGRDTLDQMDTVGLLIRFLPAAADLKPEDRILDLLRDIRDQITGGLEHSCYPYTVLSDTCVQDDSMCILYQESLKSADRLTGMGMEHIPVPHNNSAFQNTLDIEIMDTQKGFSVLMEYARSTYSAEAMEKFMDIFRKVAYNLTDAAEAPELTVADILIQE